MFRQSQGSEFTQVWEFKEITMSLKEKKNCHSLPARFFLPHCSWCRCEQLCIFPQPYSESTFKLRCTIQINKQVSKRGQITVKPTKDGCSWNNPWWPDFPSPSIFTQLKGQCLGHPAPCVGSCGEPPSSSYCYYSNCARNVGGSATSNICGHLQGKIVLILFCSVPLLNPHTWLHCVTNEF